MWLLFLALKIEGQIAGHYASWLLGSFRDAQPSLTVLEPVVPGS